MMGMMDDAKKKSAVTMILGGSEKKMDESTEEKSEGYDGETLAKELISAIKGDEPGKVFKAFKTLISYCKNDHDY